MHRLRRAAEHARRVRPEAIRQPRLLRHIAGGRVQHPHGIQPHQPHRRQVPQHPVHRQHQRGVPERAEGARRVQQPLHDVQDRPVLLQFRQLCAHRLFQVLQEEVPRCL